MISAGVASRRRWTDTTVTQFPNQFIWLEVKTAQKLGLICNAKIQNVKTKKPIRLRRLDVTKRVSGMVQSERGNKGGGWECFNGALAVSE